MGMYTKLEAVIQLTPEGLERVNKLHKLNSDERKSNPYNRGDPWLSLSQLYPEFIPWSKIDRRNFIPWGSSAYFDEPQKSIVSNIHSTWDFCCSLKNYEDEIRTFLTEVVPHLGIITGTVRYEEWEKSITINSYLKGDYSDINS